MISDIGMPGMDGYQLIGRAAQDAAHRGAAGDRADRLRPPQDIERALQAGFDAHLGKPVDFARMRATMASVLAGAPIARKAPDPS